MSEKQECTDQCITLLFYAGLTQAEITSCNQSDKKIKGLHVNYFIIMRK